MISCINTDRKAVNAHYGILNTRFDDRHGYLRSLGFVRQDIAEWNIAVYWRAYRHTPNRKVTIQASEVMHSDDICWGERITELEREFRE